MLTGRRVLLLAAVVLVGIAAWVGWQAWQVNRDLSAAIDDTSALREALGSGDQARVDVALRHLQEHSAAAERRTSGHTWAALTHLPRWGDDAAGVRLVSSVTAELARHGLPALTSTVPDLPSLLPKDGRVSISAIERLRDPLAEGSRAFQSADARLSRVDPSGYDGRLRAKFQELATQVSDASRNLQSAEVAVSVLPGMLGGSGPRHYLLVIQNNAEVRATGGLPGAVAELTADQGRVELGRQVAANSFPERPEPVLPLTAAEQDIYGPGLGSYFVDANLTPDFPRSADLMRARWAERFGDQVDGVVSLDPVALSYVLGAVGPVTVGDVTLTADNVVDQLLHEVYVRYSVPIQQDRFFRRVASAVFAQVTSGAGSPEALMKALGRAAGEHRVLVADYGPESSALAGTSVTGALEPQDPSRPQVGVYLNDATGAKMSYYLRYHAEVDATYCRAGSQGLSGEIHLLSNAPDDVSSLPDYVTGAGRYGTEPGSQLVLVYLYGPSGGDLSAIQLNGKPVKTDVVDADGRPVAMVVTLLKPGATRDLTWRMTSGEDQTGDVDLSVTPGVEPVAQSRVTASACAS